MFCISYNTSFFLSLVASERGKRLRQIVTSQQGQKRKINKFEFDRKERTKDEKVEWENAGRREGRDLGRGHDLKRPPQ